MSALLLALAGCSPDAPDFHPPDDVDFSYAYGLVYRVDLEKCASPSEATGQAGFGAVLFESHYLSLGVEITRVGLDCAEVSEGLLPAGESLSVGAAVGEVLRVYTEEGTRLSAWELAHFDGGTVVLR